MVSEQLVLQLTFAVSSGILSERRSHVPRSSVVLCSPCTTQSERDDLAVEDDAVSVNVRLFIVSKTECSWDALNMQTFRRLSRFSVRTLLLLVLVTAILLGRWRSQAERQRKAVKLISESGSFVYYHEFPHQRVGTADYSAEPPGPDWLRNIVGDEYFQTVRMVFFAPTDKAMKQITTSLPDLRKAWIDAYQLTDEGLKQLSKVKSLEEVTISNGHNLSNNSMSTLSGLPNIRSLYIVNTPIDHRSVEHLAKLTCLQQLHLSRTLLTVDDVAQIQAMLMLRDAAMSVDIEPRYQRPAGKQKREFVPYNELRGTSWDPRLQK